jgi:S1-C subfamily serine protease
MSGRGAACMAAAVLAASAIAHATGGGGRAGPAVVAVETPGARAATGFVVAGGRIVTVAHAVEEGPVTVRGEDGVARPATVVRRDPSLDLAVLEMAGGGRLTQRAAGRLGPGAPRAARTGHVARLGPAATAPAGSDAAGARLLLRRDAGQASEPAVVVRRIDARVRTGDGRLLARRPALELRARVVAGDSGAPLVGADGRVAGVLFAQSDGRPGVAYAVDAAALADLLR